uniref:A-kinase anchor protein 17B n=1 Tax=Podarcis muralis TaxID=64176 RepID=A0A670K184_PODMU|nr:A-kinase anchor protein 17B [Podarcis muralis]XP_028570661.1 A-kinase anchor protein 17B [Podarcis muralis]XP_028570662.1 A-kinase anchor protein 17B [Podarcis muralis]XP_028570663.1 A-kinase anchor protein 17B [Podarcis muralis]
MNHTVVYDTSETMEFCAFHRLYVMPVVKMTICIVLPEPTGPTYIVPKWEVIEKLKKMVCPDRFASVKVTKNTKGFILCEGEADTNRVFCRLKEKLHGKMINLSGFKDDLQVVVMEPPSNPPAPQELEPTRELPEEDLAEQSKDSPGCIYLEGLPCKWFAVKGSGSESPRKDVLRAVFENFGKIKNIDIPMLDPYREEVGARMNNLTLRSLLNLRTFEAFVQYQESSSCSKAMETFKGMKLVFKGDDGKALACYIKVTSDTTDHFSDTAVNQRNLEKITLQELERGRKRNEDRGGKRTERKRRDDEEKKTGEGKRKHKHKKHGQREIEWDTKRQRKRKVTDAEDLWTEKMPNWEEKKHDIAQKREESMRLLSLLLNKVKDVAQASEQIGGPLLNLEIKRENCSFASQIQNAPKEQVNCLGQQESKNKRESKCQSAQSADAFIEEKQQQQQQQHIPFKLPALPDPFWRNTLNRPIAETITTYVTHRPHDSHSFGCFPKASREREFRKPKVYETDEFTHYLLNYYQTPEYARDFPRVDNPANKSQWQRVVYFNKDSFQINLQNKDRQCMTDLICVPNTQEKSSRRSDNWEVMDEEPEVLPKYQACASEFAKNYRGKDLSNEAEEGTLRGKLNSRVLVSATHDRKSEAEDTEMVAMASHKLVGRVSKLKDVLEEISSDSESFSEALNESRSKKERKNGGGCKVSPFGQKMVRDLSISVQNDCCGAQGMECSKHSFFSRSEYCDSARHSKLKLRTTYKRTSSKVRGEEQRVKWTSSDEEREAGRKDNRKRYSGNNLSDDEPQFFKANHCEEMESPGKMSHHKMKCKTHHTMPGAVKATDATHSGGSPFQEAHPKADKGNVDINKTGENGCEINEKQRIFKASARRVVSGQEGEARELVRW